MPAANGRRRRPTGPRIDPFKVQLRQAHVLTFLHNLVGDHDLVHRLVCEYETWEDIHEAPLNELVAHAGTWAARLQTMEPPQESPQPRGIAAHTRYESAYPHDLVEVPDAPVVLFSKGDIPRIRMIGVDGTHYPTEAGRRAARSAAASAVALRLPVVASLSSGTGRVALETVVQLKGRAVVVLNGSVCAPHDPVLVEDILNLGGAVVSEWPRGTGGSELAAFTASRIVAGLSAFLVICEVGLHPAGGAMLARSAIAANRVLIVPDHGYGSDLSVTVLGTEVLTRAASFTPLVFGTNMKVSARVAAGQPAADIVVSTPDDMARAITALSQSPRKV